MIPEHSGVKTQHQNCSWVGSHEYSTHEHNFSFLEQDIETSIFSPKSLKSSITLIMILALEILTLECFSNLRIRNLDLILQLGKVFQWLELGSSFILWCEKKLIDQRGVLLEKESSLGELNVKKRHMKQHADIISL